MFDERKWQFDILKIPKLLTFTASDFSDLAVLVQELSGTPKRVAANALYQKMGFEKNETNCYVMKKVRG